MMRSSLVSATLVSLLWAGCLRDRGVGAAAPPTSGAARARFSESQEPPPSLALFESHLRTRTARRAEAAWRCWSEATCEPSHTEGRSDDEHKRQEAEAAAAAQVLLDGWSLDPRAELLRRAAARVVLEQAVHDALLEEARTRVEGVLWDDEAPFLLADLPLLLRENDAAGRRRILAGLAEVRERRAARAREAARARQQAAEVLGLDARALLSLRVGLAPEQLDGLASRILDESDGELAPLENGPGDVPGLAHRVAADLDPTSGRSGAVVGDLRMGGATASGAASIPACFLLDAPNDVRLLGDEQGSPALARAAKGCAAAARWHPAGEPVDPIWVRAVSQLFQDSVWLSSQAARDGEASHRRHQLRLLELRRAAIEVQALLGGGAEGEPLDALATRWTSPGKEPIAGASALLTLAPDGEAADELVAMLVARELAHALSSRLGAKWPHARSDRVATALVELGARWRQEGPKGFLSFAATGRAATP